MNGIDLFSSIFASSVAAPSKAALFSTASDMEPSAVIAPVVSCVPCLREMLSGWLDANKITQMNRTCSIQVNIPLQA